MGLCQTSPNYHPSNNADHLIWFPNSSGKFSTKSAHLTDHKARFFFLSTGHLSSSHWKALCKLKIHERLKYLLWKISWEILPTKSTLNARFVLPDTEIHLFLDVVTCNPIETHEHIFFLSLYSDCLV